MKRLLAGIACLALSVGAFAQGTVIFNNNVAGAPAPIFDVDGTTRLAGTEYAAQLYGGLDANSLAPYGAALNFRVGAGAGFVNTTGVDTSRAIATVAPGALATIVIKAWQTAGGTVASFEAAQSGGLKWGQSDPITVTTGGAGQPPGLPSPLTGLTSFSLVPEPSTYALLALGAAALFLRRRK